MEITSSQKCTGCQLCTYVCPVHAVHINKDLDELFWIPKINKDICINCKKCVNACPANKSNSFLEQKKCYVAQSNTCQNLEKSTSGGVANVLARYFVRNAGVVYGAAFDEKMELNHIRCVTESDCERIQGSKYVQSNICHVYDSIYNDLKREQKVLFIGTPCQCAAIKKIFSEYSNFFCCDFICNGVGSPYVFKKHIEKLEQKYKCKIVDYNFRPKFDHYLEPYEMFVSDKNRQYRTKSPWNKWGSLYYAGLIMRESCYQCKYSSDKRIGNMTFSDIPVNLAKDRKLFPNDMTKYGASLISINDSQGEVLFQAIKDELFTEEVNIIISDRNRHSNHSINMRNDFCVTSKNSFDAAKMRHLGVKLRIKSLIIEMIELIKGVK